MDEQELGDFYLSCDSAHRELFSVMIHEWQEIGLEWNISGRAVVLGKRSVIRDQMMNFFDLHLGESIYPASIRLDANIWRQLIGQEETDTFLREMKSIDGMECKQRDDVFSIDDPGHLSGPVQQQLRDHIKRFGYRLPDLVAA